MVSSSYQSILSDVSAHDNACRLREFFGGSFITHRDNRVGVGSDETVLTAIGDQGFLFLIMTKYLMTGIHLNKYLRLL